MTTPISLAVVEGPKAGMRLDLFLASREAGRSRASVQALIAAGKVSVNGRQVEKDYRVKAGDIVEAVFELPEEPSLEPDPSVPFEVVYDSPDLAVINKPAGVVVHPSHAHKKGTLVNGLLARWPQVRGVGEDPLRPGIVHRLDKDTSGLMVIAKTQEAFLWLKRQFQGRDVEKRYLALVVGHLKKEEGEVVVPLARGGARLKAATHVNKGFSGKPGKSRFAATGFKKKGIYGDFTLLEAIPKTGRTHQIRVHLRHLGYPIAGDTTYGFRKKRPLPHGLTRQFLHAGFLAFSLPDGRRAEFSCPLSPDLQKALKGLEKS